MGTLLVAGAAALLVVLAILEKRSGVQPPAEPNGDPRINVALSHYLRSEKGRSGPENVAAAVSQLLSALDAGNVQVAILDVNATITIPPRQGAGIAPVVRITAPTQLTMVGWSLHGIEVHVNGCSVTLDRCEVKQLKCNADNRVTLRAERSTVAALDLDANSVELLDFRRTFLGGLVVPVPGAHGPFTGQVTFAACNLGAAPENAQGYRNARHHLLVLQNGLAANTVHSAELKSERQTLSWFSWLLSCGYGIASDYGNAPGRPVLWVGVLWAIGAFVLLVAQGAVCGLPDEEYIDWQKVLLGSDIASEVARSALLSLQSLANPLGLLPKSDLLVARTLPLQAWLSVQGLLSTILVALFILAVRRKFRMVA